MIRNESGEKSMPLTTEATSVAAGAEQPETWYEEFYAALEAKDISVLDRLCTPDTRVQFANHEPSEGRAAVREVMLHFWSTIERMHHRFTNVFEVGDQALLEADVTYTRLDGSSVVIKCATVMRRRDGLVADQHIYIDLTPLTQSASGPDTHPSGEGEPA
jgi:ketosteroid isomerase-like protein